MPSQKFNPKLDGGDFIFLGILAVLVSLCVCIIVLLYAEIISNQCSLKSQRGDSQHVIVSYSG